MVWFADEGAEARRPWVAPPQHVTESAPESQEGIQIPYLESLLSEGGAPGTGVGGWRDEGRGVGKQ